MTVTEILKATNLGDGVAERERDKLQDYFVRTEAWEMLYQGRIDLIYGSKGTGKSALYLLLLENKKDLQERNIYLIPGEEISGDPVFQNIKRSENFTEDEFRHIWKMYIISLIGNTVRRDEQNKTKFVAILKRLQDEGLIPLDGLPRIFKAALDRVLKSKHTIEIPHAGSYSVILGEPTPEEERQGKISVRTLLQEIDSILLELGIEIWILFDRLDVAFTDPEVETPALRALFRVYLDFAVYKQIKLKVFLRDDIWERITREQGFREQSHITRSYHIRWTPEALRHLILNRFFNNPAIEDYAKLKRDMLENAKIQEAAFYSIFPNQVESGPKKPKTFDWILKRVQDGKQNPAPREVINLMRFAREQQVRLGEIGGTGSNPDGHLISGNALTLGLDEVSKARIDTLWSEYSELRKYIELFRGGKTEHSIE